MTIPLYESAGVSVDETAKLLKNGADPNVPYINLLTIMYPVDKIYTQMELYYSLDFKEWLELLFSYGANPFLADINFLSETNKNIVIDIFWKTICAKWISVGGAFRLLNISALEQMHILENMFPGSDHLSFEKRWKLITTIKHF